jgi:hypothetical protein
MDILMITALKTYIFVLTNWLQNWIFACNFFYRVACKVSTQIYVYIPIGPSAKQADGLIYMNIPITCLLFEITPFTKQADSVIYMKIAITGLFFEITPLTKQVDGVI